MALGFHKKQDFLIPFEFLVAHVTISSLYTDIPPVNFAQSGLIVLSPPVNFPRCFVKIHETLYIFILKCCNGDSISFASTISLGKSLLSSVK